MEELHPHHWLFGCLVPHKYGEAGVSRAKLSYFDHGQIDPAPEMAVFPGWCTRTTQRHPRTLLLGSG